MKKNFYLTLIVSLFCGTAEFCLGQPVVSVTPPSINETINSCNDSITKTLTVGNTGTSNLDYTIEILPSVTEALFYDGFESGDLSNWNIEAGAYSRTVTATGPAAGTYCFEQTGGNGIYLDGISHAFPATQSNYISFKLKSPAGSPAWNCGVNIGNSSDIMANGAIADSWIDNSSGTVYMYCTSGTYSYPMTQDQWYTVEYRNINYTTKTFDYYVNGNLLGSNLVFWNTSINDIDVVHLFGWTGGATSFYDDIFISRNMGEWVIPAAMSGTVAPTGSDVLNVKLKSTFLQSGTHVGSILVKSNDPVTPLVTVPCTLTVNGIENINMAVAGPCYKFDTIMVGGMDQDTFAIENLGCDTLFITNVTSSTGQFIIDSYPAYVPGYETGYLIASFAPTTPTGTKTATLTVFNSDLDTAFCVQGHALPAPTISVSPTSFNVTIPTCNDSVTQVLTINNTGAADLNAVLVPGTTYLGASFKYGYICNANSNNVSVVNSETNALVGTIAVGTFPWRAAIRPDSKFVYVCNRNSNNISVINTTSNTVVTTIALGGNPGGIAFTQDSKFAYVADRTNGNVKKIDCTTNTIVTTINSPNFSDPQDIAITPNGTRAFVCTQNTGITVIDVATDAVIGNIPGSNGAHSIVFTPDGSKAYISEPWNDQVRVVNVSSISTITFIYGFNEPHGLDITRDGSTVYVLDKWNSEIDVINVSSNTIVNTITDARLNNGWDLILSHKGKYIYASNPFPGNANEDVMIYDRASLTFLGTLSTGNGTRGLATIKDVYGTFFNVTPSTATVTPSGSTNISVEFNGLNIPSGTYTSYLNIYSNDPVNPLIQVPCTLNITAPADFIFMGLSDTIAPLCLDMDSIMAYTGSTDTIFIRNTGCDTLTLDGYTFTPAQFALDTAVFPIAPGEEGGIVVLFSPTAPGTYSGTIAINTNDLDTVICLFGKAYAQPVIGVTPTSFTVTVNCADTVQDTIFIANTGGSILNYSISENAAGDAYDSTITTNLTTGGQLTNFVYTALPYSDSLYLTVTLNGDFDSGSEYAELYIDGNYIGIITDYNQLSTDMTFNYAFGGAQVLTWLADGQVTVTLDNTSSVGSGGYHRSQLVIPGMAWLSETPLSGSVPIGSTDTVLVEFNSSNLLAGQYSGTVLVNSNDPLNTPVQVPCTLVVLGSPDLHLVALGDTAAPLCLDMDSIMAFTTSTDTIFLTNWGCDSLVLDSIQFSPSVFSLDTLTASILPGDTGGVVVQFTPNAAGSFSGTVTIYTNDIDTVICLKGKAFPQPVQTHVPASFNVSLGCNDSIMDTLIIYNTGGSDLTFQLEGGGAQKIKVALLAADGTVSYQTDVQTKLMNTGRFTQVDIFTVNSMTPTLAQLQPYDAVLVWSNSGFSNPTLLGDNLADYVDGGGGVVTCVFTNASVPLAGRFNTSNYWCIDPSGQTSGQQSLGTVYLPAHPIMKNVATFDGGSSSYRESSFSVNPLATRVADWTDGRALVAVRKINGTYRADLGMFPPSGDVIGGGWISSTDGATLMANALHYSANGGVDWLTISPLADTLAPPSPSDSSIISMEFNSSNLIVGTYTASVIINSNDPQNSSDTVSVTLNVVGAPQANYFLLDSIGTCLDMDSIMAFTSSMDTIAIYNTGCDTLFIDSIKYSSPTFSTLFSASYILPNDTNGIVVQFSPVSTGTITGTVTVYTNDNDPVICLYGEAFPQPVISFVPDTFQITLGCNDTLADTLVIFNSGGSNLSWLLSTGTTITDNFNPAINSSMWSFNNGVPNTDCGSVSGNALWMGDNSTRIAATIDLNTTGGGTINYYLKIAGTGSNCEAADGGEDVVLEYSTNGGGLWTQLAFLGENSYPNFTFLSQPIPPAAQTSSTRFRWRQLSHSGGCCDHWALDNISISTAGNCGAFVCINPTSGITSPASSDTAYIEFTSTGLLNGQYNTSIIITSNDPVNNPDTIPVILNVVGTPQAQLFLFDSIGTCLDLDSIMEFTTGTDTIAIFNTGCDTLFIDSLKFTPSPVFSQVYTANYILPGDTDGVVVQFAPVASGTVTGTVTVYTNDTDPIICLYGESYARPIQVHTPASYSLTLTCNDTLIDTLIIYNTGGSDLTYEIAGTGMGLVGDTSILVIQEGSEWGVMMQSFIQTNFGKNPTVINSSQIAATNFSLYDIIITTGNQSSTYYNNLSANKAKFEAFVNSGGIVQYQLANYTGTTVNLAGGMNSVPGNNDLNNTVVLPSHPVVNGLPLTLTGNDASASYLSNLPGNASTIIRTQSAAVPTTVEYMLGNGMVIASTMTLGYLYSNCGSYPASCQVLQKLCAYTMSKVGTIPDWMSLSSTIDTVAPPPAPLDSSIISIQFTSTNLIAGTYTTNIIINSNDPLNSPDTIPVTLNVAGTAIADYFLMDSIGTCLDLDSIMESTTSVDTVGITNTGCDTLFINSLNFSDPSFTAIYSASFILPGDTDGVIVQFAPLATGTITGTMTVNTNIGSPVICLYGESFAKPVQCHNPNSFNEHFLVCVDSIVDTLAICNTGAGNLNYSLWSPYGRSLKLDGSSDNASLNTTTLPTGNVMTVEAWIKPASYPDPSYTGVVSFGSRGCTGNAFLLSMQSSGRPSMATWCNDFVPGTGPAATLNQWNHIACVMNGTSVTLYMNGTPISGTLPYVPTVQPNWLAIGSTDYPGRTFDGNIDEVRIYNRALTQTEILATMHHSLTGTEYGLMGYWNFDDSTTNDLTAYNNDASLSYDAFITHDNVSFLPASTGSVTPSGTYSVQVVFKKAGLAPGTYNYPIYLHSNDPLNAVDTVAVTIDIDAAPPSPTAGSSSPVCEGTDLSLTASTISGATYTWTGPNGFTSSLQNPVITGVNTAAGGTYSVTAAVSGCPQGAAGTTSVVVNPQPGVPSAGSNSTVCTGNTLSLTASTISGATYAWTGPGSFTSSLQNPTIGSVSTAAAGTYSVTATVSGCPTTAAGTTTVAINVTPPSPTASGNSPVCAGNNLSLTASTISGATYAWTGPNSFTDATQNPEITGVSTAGSGTYSVTATANGCVSNAGTTSVTVNPQPAVPSAGSNSTVCSGKTLSLTASTISGASYAWTGPDSFTASVQNPSISGVSTAAGGTYSVTATVGGCPTTAPGTTAVVINPTPAAPGASNSSPVCVGADVTLTASTVGGSTYTWTGPSSYTSTSQVSVRTAMTVAKAGTYSVTATEFGCTSSAGTTTVVVNTPPSAPTASGNSPVCVGSTLSLSASTISGATYAWTGPDNFTASVQNPTLSNASTAAAGTYSVTASTNGCVGAAGTTSIVVNTPPSVPTASNNSTVCSGQVLSLTASTVAGATYSWSGPNSFTSNLQNPVISGVSTAANGTYSVSAIIAGCAPSAPGTTTATVNQTPGAPSASSNSPVCEGNNLSLTAGTIPGAAYSWNGPNSFTDAVQNPGINGVTVAGTGTYSVTATVAGCTGPAGTTSVTVNPSPGAPTAGSPGTICSGTALTLSASTVSGATYNWSGPDSFTSTIQNPSISGATTAAAGTYSVYVLVGGCPASPVGTTSVQVNQTPGAPTAGSNSPVCVGSDISLTATNPMGGVSYAWTGPNSFTDATQNPVIPGASTSMSGTYSVTATSLGCTGPQGTTTVTVNPPPGIPTPGSNTPVCSGTTLSLTANSISGATYTWSGPNNFTASVQNPAIAGISTDGAGTYSVYAAVGGCPPSGTGTTTVIVNQSPAAPSAGSNSPVCSGQTLSLSANTIGGATYSWNGPVSFTSTSEDPSRPTVTTAMAGNYSVVATVSGCPSPAGTVSVTINQTPGAPTITGSSTVCSGQTLSLTASLIAGATYAWTGPNSFTASTQSMSIANVTTSDAGTYSVVATNTGCAGTAGTVTVVINQTPAAPGASSNTPVCSGQTLSLSAGSVSGATYSWSGPNSFTSSLQNPNIASATTADNGTYSVTASVSGCGSSASTTSVVVNQTPSAPSASNNTPVCVGSPFTLSASTISGATYSWNGPNSFTDVSQNPAIVSAATTHTGTYSVTATVNGCTGPAGTTSVSISIPPPVPAAGNNGTICSGQNLSLSASAIAGAVYAWTGPNSFTASVQNPVISAAGTADAGIYSVTATTAGCPPSAAGTTTATINQTPSAPVASSNSAVCEGFALSLSASAAGTSYAWTGPAGFSSTSQNPVIAGVTTGNAGTYSVTATALGCTGPEGTTSVVVNTIPAQPAAADQSACEGSANPAFTATGSNIQWYDNAMTFLASGSSYTATVTTAGTYTFYATQTVNGCESPGQPVLLTINALPPTPVASNDVSICLGNPAPTFSVTGGNIQWYNASGTVVGTSSTFTPSASTPGVFTYYVTQTNTVTTCESLRDSVKLTINSIAPPVAPDVAVCSGNPVPPLTATGTSIQWYDSNNNPVFSGSPFNTGQSAVGTYTYYVTQTNTVTTCSSPKDTVYLIISTQPTAAPVIADAAACFGTTTPSLVATTGTIINWHSDAGLTNQVFSGNPFNTGLTAPGSYTFFATDSTPGCGEGPAEPVVLTIHSLPATLSVNDTTSCFGTTTPDLITSGTNIQWYNSLLAVVSTNDTFATGQTVVGTYTYYVTQTNTVTTCESAKDTVHLTIHGLPLEPTALDTAVCSASVIPNLVSTGTNVQWYDTTGIFLFTGNSYATGQTTPGTYSYLVTQKDAVTGCESPADTSVLSILLTPPVPIANNVAVCQGNPIPALVATGYNPQWYSNVTLTTLVHSGNTFNTGNTAVGIYTYWVKDSLSGCVSSSADSATLTINAAPAKPTAGDATICMGAAPTLTATATNAHWFNDATLINMVGTGSPFNTGLTGVGTYTYYVTDFAAGCGNSVSDTAVITINPNPLVTVNTYTTTLVQGDSTVLHAYNAATFSWAPPTGLNTTAGASVVASPTVTTTYTVTGTNSYGCSSIASILVIVSPLSVASIGNPVQDIHIYPNPAIGNFTLEFNTTLETPIDIYMINALGDKVRVMQTDGAQGGGLMKHKYNIDARTLTEGVYNIEIVTDHGSVNRRVVLFR